MAGRSSSVLSAVGDGSRRIARSYDNQSNFRLDNQRGARIGGGRGRNNRFRRGRNQRFRGDRGRGRPSYDYYDVPMSYDEWERKLEGEGADAFIDLSLCFRGTNIPFLEAMGIALTNPGTVAGQELHAIMLAAVRSMITGRVVEPDGSRGRRILARVLQEEASRLDAGG